MKRIALAVSQFALLAVVALPAHAAETKDLPGMKEAGKQAADQAHKGEGTVNKVDEKSGKVNLSHGPIQALKWPAMTMDFAVKDKQALTKLKPGQKVEFKMVEQPKGRYLITEIAPVK